MGVGDSKSKRRINTFRKHWGLRMESKFLRNLNATGLLRTRKSSHKQDRVDKYDFSISAKKVKVQYKSSLTTEPYVWIEIKNVSGKMGSLFGKADIFIYSLPNLGAYIIIQRSSLVDIYEKHKNSARLVSDKKKAKHNFYRRKGNRDIIMKIPISELENEGAIIVKNSRNMYY